MKTKVMIPALAFVFAIGMSFATEKSTIDNQAKDYILENGLWQEIPEQPCVDGGEVCRVEFVGEGGEPHDVYDEMDTGTLKTSVSGIAIPIERP